MYVRPWKYFWDLDVLGFPWLKKIAFEIRACMIYPSINVLQ